MPEAFVVSIPSDIRPEELTRVSGTVIDDAQHRQILTIIETGLIRCPMRFEAVADLAVRLGPNTTAKADTTRRIRLGDVVMITDIVSEVGRVWGRLEDGNWACICGAGTTYLRRTR